VMAEIKWSALIIGVLGFLVAYFFDWASLRKVPGAKKLIWLLFLTLEGLALFLATWQGARFWLPTGLVVVGWVLLPFSIILFIYSLFIEIPFRKTYLDIGVGQRLIKSGTYALVRHPGVIWYSLFLLSLVLVTRSITLLVAAPVWVVMDVIYVVVQDRFFFDRMFTDYGRYRQDVPMLVPTVKSLRNCLRTLVRRRQYNGQY